MKGKGKSKLAQQRAYFAKLANGKNTASPDYWKNKIARPTKQERRINFKSGMLQDVGKQSKCTECGSNSYGKHHRGKYGGTHTYCTNCAYGASGRGWV